MTPVTARGKNLMIESILQGHGTQAICKSYVTQTHWGEGGCQYINNERNAHTWHFLRIHTRILLALLVATDEVFYKKSFQVIKL